MSGKSIIAGIATLFILAFASRKVAGALVDRSSSVRAECETILAGNKWLKSRLSFQSEKRLTNIKTGSEARFFVDLPAIGSIDFAVADAIADWPDSWSAVWPSIVAKTRGSILVTTSGGFPHSWQSDVRARVISDPAWHFERIERPSASWAAAALAEQARILTDADVMRLHFCRGWSSAGGSAARARGPERGPLERWRSLDAIAARMRGEKPRPTPPPSIIAAQAEYDRQRKLTQPPAAPVEFHDMTADQKRARLDEIAKRMNGHK